MGNWTSAGYWNTVLGDKTTIQELCDEFGEDFTESDVANWLAEAEAEACIAGGLDAPPEEWRGFHTKAVELIVAWADKLRNQGDLGRPIVTVKPVTVSGWYERPDGSVIYCAWINGYVRQTRVARDWAHVALLEAEEQRQIETGKV